MSNTRFKSIKPNKAMPTRAEYLAAQRRLIEQYQIKVEELTQEQLAKALLQAIECGDFTRCVRKVEMPPTVAGNFASEEQMVIYVPFAREASSQSRIKELEALLTANNIVIPPANTAT